jgi:hypothetical protein
VRLNGTQQSCTRLRNLREDRFLVLRVPLDRVYEIRNQIRSTL